MDIGDAHAIAIFLLAVRPQHSGVANDNNSHSNAAAATSNAALANDTASQILKNFININALAMQ